MPTPLTPEADAQKIADLEDPVRKLDSRVRKLEEAQKNAERAARLASATLSRF